MNREWTADRLQSLCEESAEETLTLEFKQTLALSSRRQKKELAKDVSGMANAAGGTIIYGVVEAEDQDSVKVASSIAPLGQPDLVDRMDDILNSSITPPVNLRIEKVEIDEGYCIVLHVSHSEGVLHQVAAYDDYAFYRRTEKGVRPMDAWAIQREFEALARTSAAHDEAIVSALREELADADRPYARVVIVPLGVEDQLVEVARGRPPEPVGHRSPFGYYKLNPSRDGWQTENFGDEYSFRVRRSGIVQYVAPWAPPSDWTPVCIMNAISRACSLAKSFWTNPFVESCAVTVIDSNADLVWKPPGAWDSLVAPEGRIEVRTRLPRSWTGSPAPVHRAVADRLWQAAGCERSPLHDKSGEVTALGKQLIEERANG